MSSTTTTTSGFNRRNFLGAMSLATAGVSLASCSRGPKPGSGGAAESANVTLPTYKQFTGATPDFPGNQEGLQSAFRKMPRPVASTQGPPLKGKVTGLSQTFDPVSPGMKDNPYWQRLNQALGGELDVQIVVGDKDYPPKFATVLASNDLPDLMWVPPNQGIPDIGPMLEAKFEDLTKYLSADAINEYPNLAALKPDSWKTAVVGGKIWGAPIPSTPFGQVIHANKAVWAKVGGLQCTSATEFMAKVKEINDPKSNRYALEPAYINVVGMIASWLGVPSNWTARGEGKLVNLYETEQFKAAVSFAADLFKAGVFYPDAKMTEPTTRVANGSLGAQVSSGPHATMKLLEAKSDAASEILIPFAFESGITPVHSMGRGTVGFTAFKKTDEGRIRELLGLIDWLSAPFGTTEFLKKNYGTQGQDFTIDGDGNPTLNPSGLKNIPGVRSALNIMSSPENVLFFPGHADSVEYVHQQEQKLVKMGWRNATAGTYSDAETKLDPPARTALTDKVIDIVTGRAPLSDLDAAVARWRKDAGDTTRKEYEAVLPSDVRIFSI